MQMDLWKFYINSRIFEFLPHSKNQTLAHVQKCDCVPLIIVAWIGETVKQPIKVNICTDWFETVFL